MMRILLVIGVVLVVAVGAANIVHVQRHYDVVIPNDLESRIDRYLHPYVETGNFMGAILIARGDSALLAKGYGWASVAHRVPNTPETVFHIASVSKPFTTAAVLLLAQEGRLSLQDPVTTYIPDFPNGDRITIHLLMIHSTGIPNINSFPEYDDWSKQSHTTEGLIERFKDRPLQFEPGERYSYSNSNYNILAHIIELVSGQSYGEFLEARFFEPLGMKHTGHDGDPSAVVPHEATGYIPRGLTDQAEAPYLDWTIKTGNGSLYSTVGDLFIWHRALAEQRVLGEAMLRQAYTEHLENTGYGWFVRERFGGTEVYINGRSPGFAAYLGRYLDEDLCVVVLVNTYNTDATAIGRALAAITLDRDVDIPQFSGERPDPEFVRAAVGTYQFGPEFYIPNQSIRVYEQDGHLFMNWGWMMPEPNGEFRDRSYWTRMRFIRDASGGIAALQIDAFTGARSDP